MKQNTHIYYHADIDGVFSAILYLKMLYDQDINPKFSLQDVNYDWENFKQSNIREKHEQDNIVIVDFLYHEMCNQWFDHHKESGPKTRVPGYYIEGALSCAEVIYSMPERAPFKDESLVRSIVDEVSMIDYALYPNIEMVFEPTSWGTKLRLAFYEELNSDFMNELIRMFVHDRTLLYKLQEGILPWSAEWRYHKCKIALDEGYNAYSKIGQMTESKIAYHTNPPYVKVDRYAQFRKFPDSLYTVYIRDFTWMKKGIYIALSRNPWNPAKSINLKAIAEKFGGGGHQDVAGISLSEKSLEEGFIIQKQIINEIESQL